MISNKYIIRSVIHHDIIGIYDDKSEAIHKAKMRSIKDGKAYYIYKQIETKENMLYKCTHVIDGDSITKIKVDCSYDKL